MKAFCGPIVALGQRLTSAADTIRRGPHEPSISTLLNVLVVELLTPRGEPRQKAVVGVENGANRTTDPRTAANGHQGVHAVGSVAAPATSGEREEPFCGRRFVPAADQRSQHALSTGA